MPLYPYMHLAPDGRVFNPGPEATTRFLDTSGTGSWSAGPPTNSGLYRSNGTSVLDDRGQVLLIAGGDPPTASVEVVDLYNPAAGWRFVAPMEFARRHHNAVILADGTILVTGGSSQAGFNDFTGAVYAAEVWDPESETWSTLAGSQTPRIYHSFSLLLPDARVLTGAGGRPAGAGGDSNHFNAEVYSPAYLFKGPRPVIDFAPDQVGYGDSFLVATPDAADIAKVNLIRLSSVTHSFDQSQNINRLDFVETPAGLQVTAPASGAQAPPGPYMLFIVDSGGVPSVAKMLTVSVPSCTGAGDCNDDDPCTDDVCNAGVCHGFEVAVIDSGILYVYLA